jgi:predicted AAA+ superfamily ATPase
VNGLLGKLDKLLDRYVDGGPEARHFLKYQAFMWDGTRQALKPIQRPIKIDPDDLIGIESIKKILSSIRRLSSKAARRTTYSSGMSVAPASRRL